MTLFEKIEFLICTGYAIEFSSFAAHFKIKVSSETIDGKIFKRESQMPLSDHFREQRIVDCIDWSVSQIEKEIEN